jgi:hypothetical protein
MKIITRAAARAKGLTHYFTGKPCKYGHISERRVAYAACLGCEVDRERRRRKDCPAYLNEKGRRYIWKRRGKPAPADPNVAKRRESKRYFAANRDKMRQRQREINLPPATRPEPVACECCGKTELRTALHLDHCHETETFRGWLCGPCNTAIGMLGDNARNVMRAVDYLRRAERNHPFVVAERKRMSEEADLDMEV